MTTRDRNPIHIIVWRLIWFVPITLALFTYLLLYAIGFGYGEAKRHYNGMGY